MFVEHYIVKFNNTEYDFAFGDDNAYYVYYVNGVQTDYHVQDKNRIYKMICNVVRMVTKITGKAPVFEYYKDEI